MELWAQYGLLGLVLAGLGGLGMWSLKHLAQPLVAAHIEFLKECTKTMQDMRAGLQVITESANEIKGFRVESMNPNMPYSAVKGERGLLILGEMIVALASSESKTFVQHLQMKLQETLRRD